MGRSRYTRRRFLRDSCGYAAALSSSPLLLSSLLSSRSAFAQSETPLRHTGEVDCIVIGAGMAGITSAYYLQNPKANGPGEAYPVDTYSPQKVMVLEASTRIGGRIFTSDNLETGRHLELGATYIHRQPGGVPLWNEVNRFKMETKTLPRTNDGDLYHRTTWAGGKSTPTASSYWGGGKAKSAFLKINAHEGPEDYTPAEWIVKQQYDTVLGQDILSLMLTGHMPARMNDLSVLGFREDDLSTQLMEYDEYYLTEGYTALLNNMARGLDVRYGDKVKEIRYRANGGVEVEMHSGAIHKAKSVVCTVSVGMLRSKKITFSPELPMDKLASLEFIKPAHHTIITLQFKERFWPDYAAMVHLVDKHRRAGRTYFNTAHGDPNNPGALSALVMGDDAERIHNLTDDQVSRAICSDFDEIFPEAKNNSYNLIATEGGRKLFFRKQWWDDPFSMGGNCYLEKHAAIGSVNVQNARKVYASSEFTRPLFWAGEASAFETQAASVHGAHATGMRAAYEVHRHLVGQTIPSTREMQLAFYKHYKRGNGGKFEF